jgi:cytochrome c553
MKRAAPLALIAGAAFGLAATALADAGSEPQPTKLSWRSPAGDPVRGAELAETCLTCHAADSPVTDPVAPKLHRQRQSYVVFALAAFRDGGRESAIMGPMVAGLRDQDLRDVSAYLSGELLDRPPDANVTHPFHAKATRECAACHGETGIGEFEGMPVLAGQDASYLAEALEEYRTGVRKDPTMRAVAAKLGAADAQGLAAYYASHQWLERHP